MSSTDSKQIAPVNRRWWWYLLTVLWLSGACPSAMSQADDVWLLIDTEAQTLSVMQDETTVQTFPNIALGSNGTTWNKRLGDEKTPFGDYRINDIRKSSRFHLFLSLNYPTMAHVQRAHQDGRIDEREFQALSGALERGLSPPQNTRLGGFLGIHGLGAGDPEIHESVNWTNGCIALTDAQVDELAKMVIVGTRVNVR